MVSMFAFTNELPLRQVFSIMDWKTKGPDLFSGPIGKQVFGDTSTSSVVEFGKILIF